MEGKNTVGATLHSAEHIFARSLQNLGLDIKVIKADTFRDDGKGFLTIAGKVPLENLLKAELNVNSVIHKNLKTTIEVFDDIKSAEARYPNLRFNGERLKEMKNIRVVKLGEFDVCACKNEHVDNTEDIKSFVVVDVSYLRGDTQIEFKAGLDAINYLIKINNDTLLLGQDNNFKVKDLVDNYKNISKNLESASIELDKVFLRILEKAHGKFIDLGNLSFSRFYKLINDFVKTNPEKCILIVSESQLLAIRGVSNKSNLKRIGMMLKERKAFVGDVREDYINGKVLDYPEINLILSEVSDLMS